MGSKAQNISNPSRGPNAASSLPWAESEQLMANLWENKAKSKTYWAAGIPLPNKKQPCKKHTHLSCFLTAGRRRQSAELHSPLRPLRGSQFLNNRLGVSTSTGSLPLDPHRVTSMRTSHPHLDSLLTTCHIANNGPKDLHQGLRVWQSLP